MNKTRYKFGRTMVLLLVILIAIAFGGGEILHTLNAHFSLRNEQQTAKDYPQKITDQKLREINEEVENNSAKVRISLKIKISANRKIGDLVVENLPTNKIGLRFSLKAEGDKKPFFRSEMILPGYGIYQIPLKQDSIQSKTSVKMILEFYNLDQEKKIAESFKDIKVYVDGKEK